MFDGSRTRPIHLVATLAVGWMGQLIFLLSLTGQCKCSGNRIKGSLFQPGQHTNTRITLSCFSRHSAPQHKQQQTTKHCLFVCFAEVSIRVHQVRDVMTKTTTGFLGVEKTVFTLLASHGLWCETLR